MLQRDSDPSEFWGLLSAAAPGPTCPGADHAIFTRAAVGRCHGGRVDWRLGAVARQSLLAALHFGRAEAKHHAHHRQQLLGLACGARPTQP